MERVHDDVGEIKGYIGVVADSMWKANTIFIQYCKKDVDNFHLFNNGLCECIHYILLIGCKLCTEICEKRKVMDFCATWTQASILSCLEAIPWSINQIWSSRDVTRHVPCSLGSSFCLKRHGLGCRIVTPSPG